MLMYAGVWLASLTYMLRWHACVGQIVPFLFLLRLAITSSMHVQHSVANMFIIPMGMVMGADISVSKFLLSNLLPVTLGNIVAGELTAFPLSCWNLAVYGV